MLPGTAVVRFISALGQRALVELLYERKLIEAESSREKLAELGLHVGDRCTISLRLPSFYSKVETETGAAERAQRPRLRIRRRPPRAA
jgi:TOBE-like domain